MSSQAFCCHQCLRGAGDGGNKAGLTHGYSFSWFPLESPRTCPATSWPSPTAVHTAVWATWTKATGWPSCLQPLR